MQGGAFQLDPVGSVYEPVEDGIGDGGVTDQPMPLCHGNLAGDDGGAVRTAVVDDLEQVSALLAGERGEPPVIEDQQPGARDALDQPGIATVGPGQGEILEQPRCPGVKHGEAVLAGPMGERAGDPCLADAGRPGDQEIEAFPDPLPCGELGHEGALEASWCLLVDVLEIGPDARLGVAQPGLIAFGLAIGGLGLEEQSEALLEAQLAGGRVVALGLEGPRHGGRPGLVEGWVCQHVGPFRGLGLLVGSVVVAGAADVAVAGGRLLVGGLRLGPPVEAVLED